MTGSRFTISASATSSSKGVATFSFPVPGPGVGWVVTAAVPTAPFRARLIAKRTTQEWAAWAGPAAGGPLTVTTSERLVIAVTGLVATSSYRCVLTGTRTAAAALQGVPVSPTQSTGSYALAGQGLAGETVFAADALVAAGGTWTFGTTAMVRIWNWGVSYDAATPSGFFVLNAHTPVEGLRPVDTINLATGPPASDRVAGLSIKTGQIAGHGNNTVVAWILYSLIGT